MLYTTIPHITFYFLDNITYEQQSLRYLFINLKVMQDYYTEIDVF